ncbi:MAG: hypothetical protein JSS32_04715 [Verrucomicrobia bacterium]|nr:hypothetical protein [Verrucomicrobiota bacterium]
MTRMSKQGKRRHVSPRRPRPPSEKTGPKKDKLEHGFKFHENAAPAELGTTRFVPKIG